MNCIFVNNRRGGGAVFRGAAVNTVTNCVFASNQANEDGGGAYFEEGNMTTVTNCTFYDNESAGRGGGIAVVNFPFNLRNSIFIDNRADVRSTGFLMPGPEIYLYNSAGDVANIDNNLIEGGSAAVILNTDAPVPLFWFRTQ